MERLFRTKNLEDILAEVKRNIIKEISNENDEYLSNTNTEEYLDYIYNKYAIEHVKLLEDQITTTSKQGLVKRYNYFDKEMMDIEGFIVNIIIPFAGEGFILLSKANQYSTKVPEGEVRGKELVLQITVTIEESESLNIEQKILDLITEVKRHLEFAHKDIDKFNQVIKDIALQEINRKTQNYKKFAKFNSTIPYPLQRETSSPKTYEVPNIRKKVKLSKPQSSKSLQPEPTLEERTYNEILDICANMALVMERSPKAYSKMDEESIRTQFLMQLNAQYEGQATGETFNGNGKTDILIRNNNQNIFIGECKFWKGEKAFLETIDQLLGYVTYRDTKTAILLFVKNNNFSAIVEKLQDIVPKHGNYVRQDRAFKSKIETAFRYIFKNKNDKDKEFFLTVMAFHVPCEETES